MRSTRRRYQKSRSRSRRSHRGGKRTSNTSNIAKPDGAMKRRVAHFEKEAQLDNLSKVSEKAVAQWRKTQLRSRDLPNYNSRANTMK